MDNNHNIELKLTLTISQEDIDDIMCTAFEGGINYWCRNADVIGERKGEYGHDELSRGNTLRLHDLESDDCWDLTLEKFMKGLKMFIEDNYKYPITEGRIDPGDIDAEDADCIIQYAIFGELMFG